MINQAAQEAAVNITDQVFDWTEKLSNIGSHLSPKSNMS